MSESRGASVTQSQSTEIYESVSGTLSASDSESAVTDSMLESMSQAASVLQSESTNPGGSSRIGSLLKSLNIFGNRK